MEKFTIKSSSGQDLSIHYYEVTPSKGFIQILHGMQEHKQRYKDFIEFLNTQGYSVIIHDHLGHGESGDFGNLVGLKYLIKDIKLVKQSRYTQGPYILFGHSMGSFLARLYASKHPVDKLIICGSANNPKALGYGLKTLSRILSPNILQKLVVGQYEKKFKVKGQWLSYNENNYLKYYADKYCGKSFKRQGYYVLGDIIIELQNIKSLYTNEVLLIAGKDDVVGNCGKDIEVLYEQYRQLVPNCTKMMYKDMTHEILQEKDNEKVYQDMLDFITY